MAVGTLRQTEEAMATDVNRDVLHEEEMTDQDRAILGALSSLFNPPDLEDVGAEAWTSIRNWHSHGLATEADREVLAAMVGAFVYARLSNTMDNTFRHLFDFGPTPTRRIAMMWKDALERRRGSPST